MSVQITGCHFSATSYERSAAAIVAAGRGDGSTTSAAAASAIARRRRCVAWHTDDNGADLVTGGLALMSPYDAPAQAM
jgi:hypothetical protein